MCGLVGIVNSSKADRGSFDSMLAAIAHRGPDDSSYYINDTSTVFLGSRRLSIIDLSEKGRMPMTNEDRSIFVCQNGEIYNYPFLRKTLEKKGHTFFSDSDTEAIVHGYEEWGTDVFNHLQGMFAISIYDKREGKVVLARDRIGIKPLYYLNLDNKIYFSSEVKSFNEIDGYNLGKDLDYDNIKTLLGFMFLPDTTETIIKNVKSLPPASYLELFVGRKKRKLSKYWELPEAGAQETSFSQAVEELNSLLLKTVEEHLMSDVPLSILLSGGLDSSLITALVKEVTNSPVSTFTAKFDHKFNESSYASEVAKYLGTQHEEVFIDSSTVNENIEQYIKDYDDLTTFDGGLITTKILCSEVAKKGVKVLLLGEGADEVFGGYSWFGLSQPPFSFLPRSLQSYLYYYAISRNISFRPGFYYKYWSKVYGENYKEDIFRNVSSVELSTQLPNHLLMKVDKASMGASIEARVPYLDHKLVEYVYKLPREYKLKGNFFKPNSPNEKYILREVAAKYFPREMISRKKRGFMLPMNDVLHANFDKVTDYVLAQNSVARKVMDETEIKSLLKPSKIKLLAMQKEYFLWRLLLLEVWAREYGR